MIVVAGEALIDLVIDPEGAVDAVLGGAPFNTARACGRLGLDVAFVGAVSNDRFGSMLASRLEADGVSTRFLTRVEEPTTLAAAELDERGAARYHFYIDGTSAPCLDVVDGVDEADAVFAGGLGLVLEPMATAIESAIVARPPRCLAMIDVNARPLVVRDRQSFVAIVERVVSCSDVVKVSDEDLEYLMPGIDVDRAAMSLLELGASVVLLTTGADNVDVFLSGGRASVPVPPVDVADTIGAGDSFGAGFLSWWMLSGRSRNDLGSLDALTAAVEAAIAVAGSTCQRRGADPPWRSELPTTWSA